MATATPKKTRKLVCTFDELGKTQKENARDSMRQSLVDDFSSDYEYEPVTTAARILGIEFAESRNNGPDIRWSGFSCQGDGASFVGSYSHAPNSPAKIREEFGTDTALWAIVDGLNALQVGYKLITGRWFTARILQDGRHYHKYTMSVDLYDEGEPDGEDSFLSFELEKRVTDLMRDFAQWIYDGLQAEYDYQTSDEQVEDILRENEYQFQATTGRRV